MPKDLKFDGKSLVTGFHGIGATGYWTIKYLIQNLNTSRVAIVDTDLASPVTSTIDGKITTPFELFQNNDAVFFKAEVQPIRGSEVKFYRDICEQIIESGFKEVVLIGGLDSSLKTDDSKFRLVHTSAYDPKKMFNKTLKLENDRLIVGPVALMLNYFEAVNFPAFAILSYASAERVDPRAAAAAVEVLSKYFSFQVDLKPLIQGAEALETELARTDVAPGRRNESIYT